MKEESKPNLGQRAGKNVFFTDDEKLIIINDYLSGNETKKSIFRKYTGHKGEHGSIGRWMEKFGIEDKFMKSTSFVNMPERKKKVDRGADDFETLKLKNRIEALEKQLQASEMKAIAFSTMVDIAEKEFNIPIRKKYNTKP